MTTDTTIQPQLDAATVYEEVFVPALFAPWPPKVVEAAHIGPGQRVLDVACGTGVLARHVASLVGPSGSVAGLDPNPGMLEVARKLEPSIEWHSGAAESLPFPDESFDAVVSQFGMMFFSDRAGAVREMLRVLKPGGRWAVAVWSSLGQNEAFAAEVALIERMAGQAAAEALRAPFVLGDRKALEAIAESAGAGPVEVAEQTDFGRFPSVRAMMEVELRGWLPIMGVHLSDEKIEAILEEAEQVLGRYYAADGSAVFTSSALIVSGARA